MFVKSSQHSFVLVLAACLIVQQQAIGLGSHRTVGKRVCVYLWLQLNKLLEALHYNYRQVVAKGLLSHWHVLATSAMTDQAGDCLVIMATHFEILILCSGL